MISKLIILLIICFHNCLGLREPYQYENSEKIHVDADLPKDLNNPPHYNASVLNDDFSELINPNCTIIYANGYGYDNYYFIKKWQQKDLSVIYLNFSILGKSNAHIQLSPTPLPTDKDVTFEVIIGAGGNTYSTIRRKPRLIVPYNVNTASFMNDNHLNEFWLKINQQTISVGKNRDTIPFLHFQDSRISKLQYVSFGAWTGVSVMWTFGCEKKQSEPIKESTKALSHLTKLKDDLFDMYDPYALPISDYESLVVDTNIEILYLNLEEKKSHLMSNYKLNMEWTDPKLKWDPIKYDNITQIDLFYRQIWLPQISVMNQIDAENILEDSAAKVFYNGTVKYCPRASSITWCKTDISNWPWDQQNCVIHLGFQSISKRVQIILSETPKHGLQMSGLNWKIASIVGETIVTKEYEMTLPFDSFFIHFKLERQSQSFIYIFVLPLIVVLILIPSSFFLPLKCSSRLFLQSITLIILAMFLLVEDQLLPVLSDSTPKIIYLTSRLFLLMAIQMAIMAEIRYVATLTLPPHWIVTKILKNPISSIFICRGIYDDCQHQSALIDQPPENCKSQWELFALLLDRVVLVIITFFVVPIEIALLIQS